MGKNIILESKYDSVSGKVVRDIINLVKKTKDYPDDSMVQLYLPSDVTGYDEYEISKHNITFSVEVNIQRLDNVMDFKVESFIINDEDILEFNITINPKKEPEVYRDLFMKLQEDVRHEIEHLLQEWGVGDRPSPSDEEHNGETTFEHHSRLQEIPAMVQGFYRKAKLERRSLDEIMTDDLDYEIEQGNLTKQEAEELLTLWTNYAKRRLPKALYRNE
tara:strand:+ start:62 stop:715 length:654 start_codon:yes stop_codon:yes gene_type:complete